MRGPDIRILFEIAVVQLDPLHPSIIRQNDIPLFCFRLLHIITWSPGLAAQAQAPAMPQNP